MAGIATGSAVLMLPLILCVSVAAWSAALGAGKPTGTTRHDRAGSVAGLAATSTAPAARESLPPTSAATSAAAPTTQAAPPTQAPAAAPATSRPVTRTTPPSQPRKPPTKSPTKAPPATCGAPANPFGFTFCGGSNIYPNNLPSNVCDYFNCIANFWNGVGYMEECQDGTYSMSGGRSGAC